MPHGKLRLIHQNEQIESALTARAVQLTNSGNYREAVPLLMKLIDNGETVANCYLGIIYECGGSDVSTNYEYARFYYARAAEDGWIDGHIGLGRIYYYGLGVDQDLEGAFTRFERIDQAGIASPIADFYLGQMLYLGEGVKKDVGRARLYLTRSLKCGYVWSQYLLAAIDKSERKYFRWLMRRLSVLLQAVALPIKYGANTWRIGLPTCTMAPAKEYTRVP